MSDVGTLSIVLGGELRTVWPTIREQIEGIASTCSEPWIAEDVYHEILSGNAYLWMTEDRDAFVVLTVQAAPYTRDLHVWIASNQAEARAADYWPQLRAIAAGAKCNRLMFESPRRWERAVPALQVRFLYSDEI